VFEDFSWLGGMISTLFWIFAGISFIGRLVQKAKAKDQRGQNRQARTQAPTRTQTFTSNPRAAQSRPQGARAPVRFISQSGAPSSFQQYASQWFDSLTASIEPNKLSEPARPTVVSADAGEGSTTAGSMLYASPEGECDTHPEHTRPLPAPIVRAETPGLSLQLDSRSLLGSVAFAEILGKPVSMRGRRAYCR
jgi:hypothetical protein